MSDELLRDHRPSAWQQNQADAAALLRLHLELEQWFADAPKDDPDIASLISDLAALKRVASWIGAKPILASGSTPSSEGEGER